MKFGLRKKFNAIFEASISVHLFFCNIARISILTEIYHFIILEI